MIINSITGGAKTVPPTVQSKICWPTTSTQYVTPDSDFDALNYVSIVGDNNLVSSNIKYGVNIFGTVGTYEHTSSTTYVLHCFQGYVPVTDRTSTTSGLTVFVGSNTADSMDITKTTGDISGSSSWDYSVGGGGMTTVTRTTTSSAFTGIVTARSVTMSAVTDLPDGKYYIRIGMLAPIGWGSTTMVTNIDLLKAMKPTSSMYLMKVADGKGTITVKFTLVESSWGSSTLGAISPDGTYYPDYTLLVAAKPTYFY